MLSSDANRHEGTYICYAGAANNLLRRHAADAEIVKTGEKLLTFKRDSFTSTGISQKLIDFILTCVGVYNEQVIYV